MYDNGDYRITAWMLGMQIVFTGWAVMERDWWAIGAFVFVVILAVFLRAELMVEARRRLEEADD